MTYNRRIIARRQITCNKDEYYLDAQCCKKCGSGEYYCFVKNVTCPTDSTKHCVPCEKGKEFVDHPNDLEKCLRCKSCDSKFGMSTEINCTPVENTKCACVKNHFCNVHAFITTYEIVNIYKCQVHSFPFTLLDADLSSHIAGIVAEMTHAEVKKFVRHHHVSEPAIDQIIQDYPGDTSEQKIRLLRVWYQRHGMKGAYGTLISSLRELKMCAAADKIEEKLKAATCRVYEAFVMQKLIK
uniref:Tumor necrosis factor receptor superfamily member 6 n=1 Tax=Corvus moneduloides TaxID=1196302 RepID=A0A8U7M4B1_CORMO